MSDVDRTSSSRPPTRPWTLGCWCRTIATPSPPASLPTHRVPHQLPKTKHKIEHLDPDLSCIHRRRWPSARAQSSSNSNKVKYLKDNSPQLSGTAVDVRPPLAVSREKHRAWTTRTRPAAHHNSAQQPLKSPPHPPLAGASKRGAKLAAWRDAREESMVRRRAESESSAEDFAPTHRLRGPISMADPSANPNNCTILKTNQRSRIW